ncbi:winged helix-turn-helix transcriptional regulator [Herbihabitans rhizosphaerae]|nr:helix-turn-helix domain-containing protein [Herbihabitans rhizosphaerae]
MGLGKGYATQECAMAKALELIGERWTLLIVRDAFFGVRRYNDFLRRLDLPRAVLAERLQALVEHGVFDRLPDPNHSTRSEYSLTPQGIALWPVVYSLARWGERHMDPKGATRFYFHVECGKRIDANGLCGECGRWVPPTELEARPNPRRAYTRTDPVSLALRKPHRLLEPLLP